MQYCCEFFASLFPVSALLHVYAVTLEVNWLDRFLHFFISIIILLFSGETLTILTPNFVSIVLAVGISSVGKKVYRVFERQDRTLVTDNSASLSFCRAPVAEVLSSLAMAFLGFFNLRGGFALWITSDEILYLGS